MKTISNDIKVLALVTVVSVLSLLGCQDPDYPAPNVTGSGPATSTARALFVNASPNAPALNFLVENVQVAQSLAPGQNSNYVNIPVGNVQLRAKAASGAIGGVLGSSDILFRAGATNQNNFASAANATYTVFVTDTIQRPAPTTPAGATNPGGPQFLVITDVLSQTLATGAAGARYFNLTPDLSPATVRISAPTSTTGVPAAVASFTNRTYRNTGTTTFSSVPAGTYRVDVFAQSSLPNSTTTTAVASTTVTFEATKLYTLYTQGLSGKRTVSIGRVQHN